MGKFYYSDAFFSYPVIMYFTAGFAGVFSALHHMWKPWCKQGKKKCWFMVCCRECIPAWWGALVKRENLIRVLLNRAEGSVYGHILSFFLPSSEYQPVPISRTANSRSFFIDIIHPKSATQIDTITWRPPRPWGQGSPRGAAARRPAPRAGSHGGDEQRRFPIPPWDPASVAREGRGQSEVSPRSAQEEDSVEGQSPRRSCAVHAVSTACLTKSAANPTTRLLASPTRRASSSRPGSAHMRRASPSTLWRRSSPRTRIRTPRGGERTLRLPRKS